MSEKQIGIAAWGTYVPATRLPFALIGGHAPKDGGPERSVAAYDEDAITMAVEAARRALANHAVHASKSGEVSTSLYFASTTNPYAEKLGAAVIAKALDLPRTTRTADFGGSLRCGTTALLAAVDAVAAGSVERAVVVAADCRLAPPRSALERNFGDAAVAFVVTGAGASAILDAQTSINNEMLDVWRTADDRFVRSWEDRFVTQHGYGDTVPEVVAQLLDGASVDVASIAHVALYAPDARSHASMAAQVGVSADNLVDPLFGRVGNCGAAFAPLLLAAGLEAAAAGERVASVSYGDGADATVWTVTKSAAVAPNLQEQLSNRRAVRSYDSYLASRRLVETGVDSRAGTGIAATTHWRDRDEDISFRGERCRRCGTYHFPAQRVCYGCAAKDDFESVALSHRSGKLLSYTFDNFFPTPEPPLVAGMVEINGGCRVYLQLCDVDPKQVRCDLPLRFVFRKIHEAGAKPNYFWKAQPTQSE